MSESIPDLSAMPRPEAYAAIKKSADAILHGVTDEVAAMATISALLHHSLGFLWTGFYRVVAPSLLQVGPYQGSLGCTEIEFGRGACGTAALERRTIIVRDVEAFPGHISCDSRSRSEIVVPVINGSDELLGVLDVDSDRIGAFSSEDQIGLDAIVTWFRKT